ncbi:MULTISPECIES: LysR family transcriptional regulator [unclassified Janthinobacterium]|uniref:LysR family transcriptional regulator n=1 Tax=unclassified Janthinobacterium TaxID=2610881 RepID=UPI0009DB1FE9|nr:MULTISPECIES: LysR family transcriptional regulator [unclassified Janthinobacterium]MEC5163742.1 DNA-binding transcriptional LysR family regulator [Janthinobacterium sp. CG_S6]
MGLHGTNISGKLHVWQRLKYDTIHHFYRCTLNAEHAVIGSLTLDQLRVLVTIADVGSFSAAGRRLHRVQSAISQAVAILEATQGVLLFDRSGHRPTLTETGRVLVEQARLVLASAARFEAVATGTRSGLEPELVIAIDPLVPTAPLIDSLSALSETFPSLPVSFSTEGLGGSLRRLRSDSVAIGICLLLPAVPDDVTAYPLLRVRMLPVVAPGHPLALLERPVAPDDLEGHVQLVLSDPVDPAGANYGLSSSRLWRFVDLGRRLDFLIAGFGWCRMPEHLVAGLIAKGDLTLLQIDADSSPKEGLAIYAAHKRSRALGRAGRWLLDDLRQRLSPPTPG